MDTLATMPKYERYKDSGYEWIGQIPESWELTKLGSTLKPVSIKNKPELPLLSITREQGVILRDIENAEANHNFIPDDLSGYKLLEKGQFGMNKMKAWQGSYGVSDYTGIVSPAYFIFNFMKPIFPAYFHKAIRSKLYVSFFGSASDGVRIGQWDLSKSRMKEIPFLVPPIEEQTAIANFLDRKTAQIEQAIAIKEKQIALLKERKQILIQNAVTRGLDPNVPMKDSGVEWIGEIPEHWVVKPLIRYATRVDYRGKTPEKVDDGVFLVTTKNIKEGIIDYKISQEYIEKKQYNQIMSRGLPKVGDILFTMEAPLGMTAVVDNENIAIAQRIIKLRFDKNHFISDFVNYSMQAGYFQDLLQRESTGSTALGIKASKLHKLRLIAPPLEEQVFIYSHIDAETAKIDKVIVSQKKQIEKFKEYKSTLINSGVTGKIKVA